MKGRKGKKPLGVILLWQSMIGGCAYQVLDESPIMKFSRIREESGSSVVHNPSMVMILETQLSEQGHKKIISEMREYWIFMLCMHGGGLVVLLC